MTAVEFSSTEASGTDTPFAEDGLSCSEILCALVNRIKISYNGVKRFRAPVVWDLPTKLSVYIEHVLCAMSSVAFLKRKFLVNSKY